jgi:hypothetical protein
MKLSKTLLPGMMISMHLMLVGGLMLAGTSYADRKNNDYRSSSSGIDEAVARVQQQTGGRVLRAQQEGSVYIIKVLMPSGVVKTFRVKAR